MEKSGKINVKNKKITIPPGYHSIIKLYWTNCIYMNTIDSDKGFKISKDHLEVLLLWEKL